jgi:Fe-S-cluster containining protein
MKIFTRECGTCNACCVAPAFEDKENNIFKLSNVNCPKLDTSKKDKQCLIYEKRPSVCRSFICSWIKDFGDENDRPDKNKLLIFNREFNNGHWFVILEMEKDALFNYGENIVHDILSKYDTACIVLKYQSNNLVGDLAVINEKIKHRCENMIDEFIGNLGEELEVYTLK